MKVPTLLSAWLSSICLFASSAVALNVVPLTISKSGEGRGSRLDRLKRAVISETLSNEISLYAANISIGTPPQPIAVLIDTGSSDTYVMASTANACQTGQCSGGTFDSTKSSTFKTIVKGGFKIKYQSGDSSSGDYVADTFAIGTGSMQSVQIGLATKTTLGFGLMGIGYDSNEATTSTYPNVVDQMVSQGLINVKAFSLYLDDVQADTGTVLFGGIDQAKFQGQLAVLPIQKDPDLGVYREYLVTLSSISITDSSGKAGSISSTSVNVVLDSGTSLTYLPKSVISSLIQTFSAVDDSANTGVILVDCSILDSQPKAYFTFSFGGSNGAQIRVPFSEMILSLPIAISKPPFPNTCVLGVKAGPTGGPYPLGDTFLRSAYVVYDQDHNQIGLAQSNFDTTSSNIYEFAKGATGIPSLAGSGSGSGSSSLTSKPSSTDSGPTLATSIVPPVASGGGDATSTAVQTVTVQTTVAQTVAPSGTKSAAAAGPAPPLTRGLLGVGALSAFLALLGGVAFLR